ncbi:MAG: T9SS type A sorting domain-containing protein [Saprospiraceae bacterium]|nr:T9SS type A sorting domain-containing protein [Saprospiraceae bacterium]
MKILLSLGIVVVLHFNLNSQNKYDYTWICGYDYLDSISGSESTLINFSDDKISVKYQNTIQKYALGSSVAVISDKNDGKLLFYSNGCAILDSTHNIMENGDSLNFGLYWENYCKGDEFLYYPISIAAMVLPNNYIKDEYYLIHQEISDIPVKNYTLNYSKIIFSNEYPRGVVQEKNSKIVADHLTPGFVTAIKSSNGRDWWLVHLLAESNKFIKFLVDSTGVHFVEYQSFGDSIKKQHAQAQFSPDGKLFAWYNQEVGLNLYDFNRHTGELTNYRKLEIEQKDIRGGLCFSPNSRYLYLFNITSVYQIDLLKQNLYDGIIKVGEYSSETSESSRQTFLYGMLAPDCKIYITSTFGSNYFSAIDYPDEKGEECGFNIFGLQLAYYNFIAAIPNFPHFRVDDSYPCDRNVSYYFGIPEVHKLLVYPNPSSAWIDIHIPAKGMLSIYDLNGRIVCKQFYINSQDLIFDVSAYAPGKYVLIFEERHRVYKGEFIKG